MNILPEEKMTVLADTKWSQKLSEVKFEIPGLKQFYNIKDKGAGSSRLASYCQLTSFSPYGDDNVKLQ